MIHVVVMECGVIPFTILVSLPLLIHLKLLWSQRFKIDELELVSEVLCTDSTALVCTCVHVHACVCMHMFLMTLN
jgi:hypothetical protein